MFAVYAARISESDPLSALELGEQPEPSPREGWKVINVKAASVNHHDLWSLRGVGLRAEQLPMILGTDAAGIDDDGNEVIAHSVIFEGGKRTVLSEHHPGALAERVAVPAENLVPKPPELSFEEAACLPTAWLTAYSMLFTHAHAGPGTTVLIQGAGGGVATALIQLGSAAGVRVWVRSRTAEKRRWAITLGADAAFEPGERLPERVDSVMETVGAATWRDSIRSVRDGGTIVISGATSGDAAPAELSHIFFRQLSVLGVTMGTRAELIELIRLCVEESIRPAIHETMPLREARRGFEAMAQGQTLGKIVLNEPNA